MGYIVSVTGAAAWVRQGLEARQHEARHGAESLLDYIQPLLTFLVTLLLMTHTLEPLNPNVMPNVTVAISMPLAE